MALVPLCEVNRHVFDGKVCIYCGEKATHFGLMCYACRTILETGEEAYDHFDVCATKASDEEEFSLFQVVPLIKGICPKYSSGRRSGQARRRGPTTIPR